MSLSEVAHELWGHGLSSWNHKAFFYLHLAARLASRAP